MFAVVYVRLVSRSQTNLMLDRQSTVCKNYGGGVPPDQAWGVTPKDSIVRTGQNLDHLLSGI